VTCTWILRSWNLERMIRVMGSGPGRALTGALRHVPSLLCLLNGQYGYRTDYCNMKPEIHRTNVTRWEPWWDPLWR